MANRSIEMHHYRQALVRMRLGESDRQIAKAGVKSFPCVQATLAGIELIRMTKKGQLRCQASMSKNPAESF